MKQYIDNIINLTNYSENCHGLQALPFAEVIAEHYFQSENLSFENWQVREIPLVDDSDKYPVAIVVIINNQKIKKEITLNLTRNGKLFDVNPDPYAEICVNTIKEAIEHESSNY